MLTIEQLQSIADEVTKQFKIPQVPLYVNCRLKQYLGLAYYGQKWKIELSPSAMVQPNDIVLSVLLHELCHMILHMTHTSTFFKLSRILHHAYGITEDRITAKHHGTVYRDGIEVPYAPFPQNKKEYTEMVLADRIEKIPD